MPVNLEGFEGRIAIVLGDEMLEPAAIFVEQQVAEVGGWALDNHVFVNVALSSYRARPDLKSRRFHAGK